METRTIDPNSSFTKGPQGTDKKIIAIEREWKQKRGRGIQPQ